MLWWIIGITVAVVFGFMVIGFFTGDEEEEASKTQVHAFVSNKTEKGLSLEEAQRLQEQFLSVMETDDLSDKINAASKLLISGLYQESIDAYQKIAEQHPEELGDCQSQIGAALHFQGRYQEAIDMYKQAEAHGADPQMMADNIEEAEEALRKA